jgi:ferredoxin
MLDLSLNLTKTSRLGCQIRVSEALSGLRVYIPSDF